jgi:nucleoid DNA-binding protein
MYKEIADDLNIDEKLVRFVDNHIFGYIHNFMENPDRWEILINNFGTFKPKLRQLKKYIEKAKDKDSKVIQDRIILYKKIIELGDNNEIRSKINGTKRNR